MNVPKWMGRQGRVGAAALLFLGMGACASAGRGAGPDSTLIVQNNLSPSSTVTIYASPGAGIDRVIGTVPPSSTDTLQFNMLGGSGPYTFVAEITGGVGAMRSSTIHVSPGSVVEWNLITNLAVVTDSN